MKTTTNYLIGIALMFVMVTSHAQAQLKNHCTYQNANQQCVTVPLADMKQDSTAKKFQADKNGKATIYVVRDSLGVKRQASVISIDGKAFVDLGPFNYLIALVPAGHHKIVASADKKAELHLNAEAGKLYFIKTDLSLLFFTVSSHLNVVDETTGKAMVEKALLVRQSIQ
jgi:hypothetical protein